MLLHGKRNIVIGTFASIFFNKGWFYVLCFYYRTYFFLALVNIVSSFGLVPAIQAHHSGAQERDFAGRKRSGRGGAVAAAGERVVGSSKYFNSQDY